MAQPTIDNVAIDRFVKHLVERFPTPAGGPSNHVVSRSNLAHTGGSFMHSATNTHSNFALNVEPLVCYLSFFAIGLSHEITSTHTLNT